MTEPHNFHIRFVKYFNIVGCFSLYIKECRRFANVYIQTIIAPIITTLLFLAVFVLALGRNNIVIEGFTFSVFLMPGLIIMTMAQNAFANTSSSMVVSKIQGNIVDVLMPPLSPFEFVLAYMLSGATRGMVVGILTYISFLFFLPIIPTNPLLLIVFGFLGSCMLALLGLVGGIWSQKFDHIAAVTNFVITPLSFLSGTFYTLDRLPDFFQKITHFNPFFYMIDGFRQAFLGFGDVSALKAIIILSIFNIFLFVLAYKMVKNGYKLKS